MHREESPRAALVVEALDDGAGIADVQSALRDGYSEGAWRGPDRPRGAGQGLGAGLGSVQRMMDAVEIDSAPGRGTRIVARKFLRA